MQSVPDDWEQKFALTDSLRSGLAELQDACSAYHTQLLLSREAPKEPAFPHRHASPLLSTRRNSSLRNLSTLRAMSPVPRRPNNALEPIETTAQFLEWYGRVESRLAAEQDAESHAYAQHLRLRKEQCGRMAQEAECVAEALQGIQRELDRVNERSSGVQAACFEQQAREARLKRMSEEISEQLSVYQSLGPIAQLLNAPGDKVCLDPSFLPSLQRIEEATEFITKHAGARDSELYLMRFGQCRTRGLTLIKMHAQREFRRLGAQLEAKKGSDVHVRFRTAAVQLRPLLEALQRHQQGAAGTQVLADVQHAYFMVRMNWLRIHVPRSLHEIEREHEDEAGMVRDWCAFMMNVCADEGRLFVEMFGQEAPLLREHEDQAMALFHEQVRPRIIRKADVESLAMLSLTLLTYQRPATDGDTQLDAFYAAVAAVLQDAQQRLAFRAQAFVQSEIARFRLSRPEALAILEALRASGKPCEYVPVERLRWLAAQIGGCLDEQVQQGIVHEALAACKQNIVAQGARALRDCAKGDPDAERLAHLFVTAMQNQAEQVISDLD
ncbi:Golgi transport complex subunit 3 [Coemansia sp. RSA 2336]|nr:Golgi transport complex subunit 3 [Coemansia sp. RSA 2336]